MLRCDFLMGLLASILVLIAFDAKADSIPSPETPPIFIDYYCDFEREQPRFVKCSITGELSARTLNDLGTAIASFELECEDDQREVSFRDLEAELVQKGNAITFIGKEVDRPTAHLNIAFPQGKLAAGTFPASLAVGGFPTLKSECEFIIMQQPSGGEQ